VELDLKDIPMNDVRALLSTAVRAGHAAGLVAMTARDGDVVCSEAVERRHPATVERMNAKTLFRTTSLLKPMILISVLQLVEKGAVDLDDRVGTYLPDVTRTNQEDRPSLRHLLTRLGGSPALEERPLTRLKLIIERASGLTLAGYLDREILAPLGLHDTHMELPERLRHRLASLHRLSAAGAVEPISGLHPDGAILRTGSPTLYSTGLDGITFLQSLLRRDARLLSPGGYREFSRGCQPTSRSTTEPLFCSDVLNTYCWVAPREKTTGLLFAQLLDQGGLSLIKLFLEFRAVAHQGIGRTSAASHIERILEYFNFFRYGNMWYPYL
jgi:CubicO group peptidase (beta-lactamase class C family)